MFIFPLKKQVKNLLCHNIFFVKSVTLVYVHTLCVFLDRLSCFGYLRRADIFPIISTFQPKSSRLSRPLSRETINYTMGLSFEEKNCCSATAFSLTTVTIALFLIPIFLPRNSLDGIGCFWYNIGTQQNKNMQTQKSYRLTCVCIFISQIFTGKNGIICPGIE